MSEDLDAGCIDWLAARCDVRRVGYMDAGFGAALADADGLIVRTYTRVDAGLLGGAPRLRVVGRAGVGLDNIDVGACRARGVEVVHTPDANTTAVTELVVAFMLDVLRPRVYLDTSLPAAEWHAVRKSLVAGRQLRECVLGVLGMGRVGKSLTRAARGLGMTVRYNDVVDVPAGAREGAEPVDVERLFAESDIVSIHIDDRASNRGFVDERLIGLMKRDVLFINASRGFVVNSEALAGFLGGNPGATAVCDVHEPEPIEAEYPLLGLANAKLTPHIGAATRMAHRNMSWVVRDVWRELERAR